jgi:hypothetical protein
VVSVLKDALRYETAHAVDDLMHYREQNPNDPLIHTVVAITGELERVWHPRTWLWLRHVSSRIRFVIKDYRDPRYTGYVIEIQGLERTFVNRFTRKYRWSEVTKDQYPTRLTRELLDVVEGVVREKTGESSG